MASSLGCSCSYLSSHQRDRNISTGHSRADQYGTITLSVHSIDHLYPVGERDSSANQWIYGL